MVQIPSDMGINLSLNINKQEKDQFKINISFVDQNLHDSKKLIQTPQLLSMKHQKQTHHKLEPMYHISTSIFTKLDQHLFQASDMQPCLHLWHFDFGSCLLFILRFLKNLTQFVKHSFTIQLIMKYISTVYRK